MQPPGTLSDDDDAPDGWHEWRRQQEAIHAALGYPAGEDDGAGVGDFDDDEVRHWRVPDPDEMFLPRSRVPGDTPPSGLEDFEPHSPDSFSDGDGDDRDDEDEPEEPGEAMMASPAALQVVDMSPTKVILDLGCTKAMGSRTAVNHFCQRIDRQGHNTYLSYEIKPTTSQFSFANSQTSKCTEKLVVYMSDYYGSTHCTEFDIVEEGQVPFLMSLPQMRNLRFSLNLTPGNASLACDPLGIYHLPLDTSRSSRLVLDLEVMAEHMYNVEFQVQRVSFFTQHVHYDYSDHAQEEPAQESGLAHQQDEISANPQPSEEALVTEDKWVLNEPNREMIRVHRKLRSQSYKPEKNNTPIPLEYLEDTRATKFEYEDGTSQQKVDNW